MRVILYQAHQNAVGGVETFNYNFCKRMSKYYDIIFLCDSADPGQLERIGKYVRTYIFDGQKFETDVCIYSSSWGKRPEDYIEAKRYIQMIHADYEKLEELWHFSYTPTPKVTEHIAGGEFVASQFKKKYGLECGVVHYLLDEDVEIKRVLRLISLSRVTKEKGFDRVVIMAKKLKELGYKFTWDVWGNTVYDSYKKKMERALKEVPEVSFKGVGRDLQSHIADSDYLVQLSDTEGYCFSMHEALSVNTPVIATAFPNAYEQIEDGVNGYVIPFEMFSSSNQQWGRFLKKIYNEIPEFKFKPLSSEQDWIKVLGKPVGKVKNRVYKPETIRVVCSRRYDDILLDRKVGVGEELEVSVERAAKLLKMGLVRKGVDKSLKRIKHA